MFDLTKNIKLSPELHKKYTISRILLHVLFVVVVLYVADRILFPVVSLDFSFASISSLKNTLVAPRLADNSFPSKGTINANNAFFFDADPIGHFSSAQISITTDSASKIPAGTKVTLQKSYQAFFYPLGDPMGFKTGTLLTTTDGNYYIVSDNLLRKFASTDIISQFGFSLNAFQTVSDADLAFNKVGPDITNANTYPDDTLFSIGDSYYQLKNQQLLPFISQRAFLSQYDPSQAITKDSDFITNYPASDSSVGFANGTLASSDQSVFILSNGKSYPVADANTFTAMGFNWNNVISLEPEELGLYEQQKQFTFDQPHPDGTVFQDQISKQYFVIENSKKRPIESPAIAKTYATQNAIVADLSSLDQKVTCQLKKQILSNTYACTLPLNTLSSLLGNDYQVTTSFANEIKIKTLNTTFSTPLNWQNLKDSLSNIKGSLKNN